MYQNTIRATLAKQGYVGLYPPNWIEALMRLQYSTLDHLSLREFDAEVALCRHCIDASTSEEMERLAESYGL